jgi:tripartite-type tricarboxylate transporter receptor subunit TctC
MPYTDFPKSSRCEHRTATYGLVVLTALVGFGCESIALAQSFPTKSMRLIVPYGPGTGADFVARQVTRRISELLGQQMVVDNRPGAGAIVGSDIVAKAAPDGYTLLFGATQTAINPSLYKRLPYNTLADFIPVARASSQPLVLTISTTLPATSVAELIAYAKKTPGQPNFTSTGSGTINHLVGAFFNFQAQIRMTHIAYTNVAQMITDLVRGEIGVVFYPYVAVRGQVEAGQLRALALTSAERSALLPKIPTMIELGYPEFALPAWQGIFAPANTPRQVVKAIYDATAKTLTDPAVVKSITNAGTDVKLESPEEFTKFFRSQINLYAKIVPISGAKAD